MRKLALVLAAIVAASAAAVAAARLAGTPGVTSSSILVGGTAPLSGEASAGGNVARGAEAYLKYLDAHGGVNRRKVVYRYLDDGYDPGKAVEATRQLVQQDGVFAIFNTLGTNSNLAIRDYLNQMKVPQLFVASGFTGFGSDYKRYPWTIGFIPSYLSEGTVYGRYLAKTRPKAKIAVLYQDDDYGKDLLSGLKRGLGSHAGQIAKAVGYDPTATDVTSQVADLKGTGADTFMVFAFGKFAIQAFVAVHKLGWKPQIFVNAVAASTALMQLTSSPGVAGKTATGAISIVFFKDPSDPAWAGDPGIKLFQKILKQYAPGADPKDGYYVAGMASAFTLADSLRKAGKNPTRDSLIRAATSLNEANNPFVLPGIVIKTSAADRFPIQQMQLERWSGKRWLRFGGLVTAGS